MEYIQPGMGVGKWGRQLRIDTDGASPCLSTVHDCCELRHVHPQLSSVLPDHITLRWLMMEAKLTLLELTVLGCAAWLTLTFHFWD